MKKSELRKIISEYNEIKIKLKKSQNKRLEEKLIEIQHRIFHETGDIISDKKEINDN